MTMSVKQSVEWELAGETEVLGGNVPRRHFVHHKSHMTWPGTEPGPPRWEANTNRLSYGAAIYLVHIQSFLKRTLFPKTMPVFPVLQITYL
jgi:hypothetical protein